MDAESILSGDERIAATLVCSTEKQFELHEAHAGMLHTDVCHVEGRPFTAAQAEAFGQ